jgi:protein translocase SecG subunit
VLVIVVLLQPGKADAGALFSSSVSSTAFGPRGTQTLLAKITIGAAASFMLIALILSLPAVSGQRSVLQGTAPDTTPTPQASPAASTAPATPPAQQAVPAPSAAANSNTGSSNANAAASPAASAKPKASPAATKK